MSQAVRSERGDDPRLLQEQDRLRGQARGEEADQERRDGEQAPRRDGHQAEIGDRGDRHAGERARAAEPIISSDVVEPADAARPYMKSTTSEPSRITATAQTTPRATIERDPPAPPRRPA